MKKILSPALLTIALLTTAASATERGLIENINQFFTTEEPLKKKQGYLNKIGDSFRYVGDVIRSNSNNAVSTFAGEEARDYISNYVSDMAGLDDENKDKLKNNDNFFSSLRRTTGNFLRTTGSFIAGESPTLERVIYHYLDQGRVTKPHQYLPMVSYALNSSQHIQSTDDLKLYYDRFIYKVKNSSSSLERPNDGEIKEGFIKGYIRYLVNYQANDYLPEFFEGKINKDSDKTTKSFNDVINMLKGLGINLTDLPEIAELRIEDFYTKDQIENMVQKELKEGFAEYQETKAKEILEGIFLTEHLKFQLGQMRNGVNSNR